MEYGQVISAIIPIFSAMTLLKSQEFCQKIINSYGQNDVSKLSEWSQLPYIFLSLDTYMRCYRVYELYKYIYDMLCIYKSILITLIILLTINHIY